MFLVTWVGNLMRKSNARVKGFTSLRLFVFYFRVNTIYLLGFGYVNSLHGIIANNGLVRISRDCSRRTSVLAQQYCGHDL